MKILIKWVLASSFYLKMLIKFIKFIKYHCILMKIIIILLLMDLIFGKMKNNIFSSGQDFTISLIDEVLFKKQ